MLVGPIQIVRVFPYGSVEICPLQNEENKFKVNGHRLKHYKAGEPLGEKSRITVTVRNPN